ncbi:hypothetical protein Ancab_021591 [Ancistrocladus abbreviatus]
MAVSASSKYGVTLKNDLGRNRMLTARCRSKDDDLGQQWIPDGGQFSWEFHLNLFYSTQYGCDIFAGNLINGHFDVFIATKYKDKCHMCQWSCREDGLWFYDEGWQRWIHRFDSFGKLL